MFTPILSLRMFFFLYLNKTDINQAWDRGMSTCLTIDLETKINQAKSNGSPYIIECSEKYKSFKLKIPQPDSKRRHSPDFRTVFGIMIGPFSSCKIGKTWGTNKQVNKQTNKNWKFQFPQPDYRPRHSPDFRTVFGIMIRPFSICEIGKTWGTNKQINKQTNKNWNF